MNKLLLSGRAGKDCELTYSPKGVAIGKFSIACSTDFKGDDGKYAVDWINVTCFKKTAEFLAGLNGGLKGCLIEVEGSLKNNNYKNKEGKMVYQDNAVATGVKVLQYNDANSQGNKTKSSQTNEQSDDLDDEALLAQLSGNDN